MEKTNETALFKFYPTSHPIEKLSKKLSLQADFSIKETFLEKLSASIEENDLPFRNLLAISVWRRENPTLQDLSEA